MNLPTTPTEVFIARLVHHVNNAICADNNEQGIAWKDAPGHMQAALLQAVKENLPAKEAHEAWMRSRLENGWVLGLVKDIENKISPCLIPYEELPYSQRIKDTVCMAIVEFCKENMG